VSKKLEWRQDGRRGRRSYGGVREVVCLIKQTETEKKESSKVVVGESYFPLGDVLEAQQFDRELLGKIFEVAREMEDVERGSAGSELLKGYLMATLFYEPSTRTRLSFESAMKRLGGEVLTTENAREFSSASKGETLEGE
jgi:aspartate carbamoyltransferase catalytic subunit